MAARTTQATQTAGQCSGTSPPLPTHPPHTLTCILKGRASIHDMGVGVCVEAHDMVAKELRPEQGEGASGKGGRGSRELGEEMGCPQRSLPRASASNSARLVQPAGALPRDGLQRRRRLGHATEELPAAQRVEEDDQHVQPLFFPFFFWYFGGLGF